MSPSFRPRRSMRSEFVQLALVALFAVSVACVFPYAALSPAVRGAESQPQARASCAIVRLTEEEESGALAAARSAWHVNAEGVKRLRIELFEDLPESFQGPVADIAARTRVVRGEEGPYAPDGVPTDMRAAPAARMEPPAGESAPAAFPRDEMLKLE